MTTGHRHRTLVVKDGGKVMCTLRGVTVHHSPCRECVVASRFPYSPDPDEDGWYRLSLLGFLHGLTGLTLVTR